MSREESDMSREEKQPYMSFALLGAACVGKDYLLNALQNKQYDKSEKYKPSVGLGSSSHTFKDGAKAQIFTSAGDSRNDRYVQCSIRLANAVIFAIDASSEETKSEAMDYLKEVMKLIRKQYEKDNSLQFSFVLTKVDLYDDLDDTTLESETREFISGLAEAVKFLMPSKSYLTSAKDTTLGDPAQPFKDMQAKFKKQFPEGKLPPKEEEVTNEEPVQTRRNTNGDEELCLVTVFKKLGCLLTGGCCCNPKNKITEEQYLEVGSDEDSDKGLEKN